MTKIDFRLLFAAAAVLMLGACSSNDYFGKPKAVDPNLFPAQYKNEILLTLKTLLIDPTNVRDAYISEPVLASVGKDQRYTVCIRSNSRGYHREYQGSKDHIAYFYGGALNQLVDAKPEQCAKANYKPFPELEKLCLGASCQ